MNKPLLLLLQIAIFYKCEYKHPGFFMSFFCQIPMSDVRCSRKYLLMLKIEVIISCLYPLWRSDPQDQVSIWYFGYWGPGLQEQKVEMEIRSPGPGPHLVFLVLRTRSPEAKGGDGDQVSSLEY